MAYEFEKLFDMLHEVLRLESEGWHQEDKAIWREASCGFPVKVHILMQNNNQNKHQELLMWGENPYDEGSFVKKLPF